MKAVKNLLEAQTSAFINYIETAQSIQNSIISGEIIENLKKTYSKYPLEPWKAYTDYTSKQYTPIISEVFEKQVDFINNVTSYNLELYKKWYTRN